ncbi:MAG TPA: serine/threonine-protein kinase [Polyangiaceae bacterium]|jgi:serine/threonine-protein kinase|nr:serine/threonine-protein kinase [Polyangiaceae bacterium]
MGEPRRRCAECGESYAEGVIFCPRDGSALSPRAADSGPDPYLGRTIAGAFRLDALIGTGAVGRVYRAHQLGVERTVALKIMHRDLATNETLCSRFRREARVAGSLSHPNLVNVILLGECASDGVKVPFIAFEYLDGLSFRSAILARGALGQVRALHIMLQVADAVGVAHEHGIVHRDLKPENLMLVQRGDDPDFVKVLDFGVARVDHGDPSIATHAGAIFGSARYISPESAAGGEATQASDVYALATILYECLAGVPPFDGENPVQILLKQQREAPPPLSSRSAASDVVPELARLVERNLAKDPAARSANARVFARELARVAQTSGIARELGATHESALSSETRRGHAFSPRTEASPRELHLAAPRSAGSSAHATAPGATRPALFVLLCFVLGAGVALGVAAKLGAFAGNAPSAAKGSP